MFIQDEKDYIQINYQVYLALMESYVCSDYPLVVLRKVSSRKEELSFYAHKDIFLIWRPATTLEGQKND